MKPPTNVRRITVDAEAILCGAELTIRPGDVLLVHNGVLIGTESSGKPLMIAGPTMPTTKRVTNGVSALDSLRFQNNEKGRATQEISQKIVELLSDGRPRSSEQIREGLGVSAKDEFTAGRVNRAMHLKLLKQKVVIPSRETRHKRFPEYQLNPKMTAQRDNENAQSHT